MRTQHTVDAANTEVIATVSSCVPHTLLYCITMISSWREELHEISSSACHGSLVPKKKRTDYMELMNLKDKLTTSLIFQSSKFMETGTEPLDLKLTSSVHSLPRMSLISDSEYDLL